MLTVTVSCDRCVWWNPWCIRIHGVRLQLALVQGLQAALVGVFNCTNASHSRSRQSSSSSSQNNCWQLWQEWQVSIESMFDSGELLWELLSAFRTLNKRQLQHVCVNLGDANVAQTQIWYGWYVLFSVVLVLVTFWSQPKGGKYSQTVTLIIITLVAGTFQQISWGDTVLNQMRNNNVGWEVDTPHSYERVGTASACHKDVQHLLHSMQQAWFVIANFLRQQALNTFFTILREPYWPLPEMIWGWEHFEWSQNMFYSITDHSQYSQSHNVDIQLRTERISLSPPSIPIWFYA